MVATLIDGTFEAAKVRHEVQSDVKEFTTRHDIVPGLAVVLVGENPASQIYVRSKIKQAHEVGIRSFEYRLADDVSEQQLLSLLDQLNNNPDIHGILVQLPLPRHIDAESVLRRIAPLKDVDGFHPTNAGLLACGHPTLVPCTPLGCMRLISTVEADLRGMEAIVIGRSNIVGRPAAQLLLLANCSVTITHQYSRDVAGLCRRADIIIAAAGRPHLVRGDWVKPGAIVIDVGINRITRADGKSHIVGDVDFDEVKHVARAITPVPGGVGPMTVATLLENTLRCAALQLNNHTARTTVTV